jgi:hypothetical protein
VHDEEGDGEEGRVAVQSRRHEQSRAGRSPPVARGDAECDGEGEQQEGDDVRAHDPPDCATGAWNDCCGADVDGARVESSLELDSELTLLEDEAWVFAAASLATAPVTAREPARSQRVTVRMRRSSSARVSV